MAISQRFNEKDCATSVRKTFIYHVSQSEAVDNQLGTPQIHIVKDLDTKKRIEKFLFQVKGHFYISHQRLLLKVRFQHTLRIQIKWKAKVFSPKKSEVLT